MRDIPPISRWFTGRRRPARPKPGVEALEGRALLTTFSFRVDDPTGQFGAFPLLAANLQAAGNVLGQALTGRGSLEVVVTPPNGLSIPRAGGSFVSVTQVGTTAGGGRLYEPSPVTEARTGVDPNGAADDIHVYLNPGYLQTYMWFDPNSASRTDPSYTPPVPSNKNDFVSMIEHEVVHALGFSSYRTGPGTAPGDSGFPNADRLVFDNLISRDPNGLLTFKGLSAQRVYGGPVPITEAPPPAEPGGNYVHLGNPVDNPTLHGDMMNGFNLEYGRVYSLTALDKAILSDLGWPAEGDVPVAADYTGDGKADPAVYRPSTAEWFIQLPNLWLQRGAYGLPNVDVPKPADYDGDGKADIAVYRPTTGDWFISQSTAGPRQVNWGVTGIDVAVPADYDGDHKADIAVYRPSTGEWFIQLSTGGSRQVSWGVSQIDLPTPADYDGDGKADLAVYRPSTGEWFILQSTGGSRQVSWGVSQIDRPVAADYDGDGKTDLAVFRPSTGEWFILLSTGGSRQVAWGWVGVDVPVSVDYNGDGKADIGVYRPKTGDWLHL